jgi:hypothetical protein
MIAKYAIMCKHFVIMAGDDQIHLWRQMVEKKGDGAVDRLEVDIVVVAKDQSEAMS